MKQIKGLLISVIFVLLLSMGAAAEDFDGLEGVIILMPEEESNSGSGNHAEQEGLVLSVNECSISRFDETYSNIVLAVSLMNWETEEYEISNVIGAKLYYQENYKYDAAVNFSGETQIGMLVNLQGTLTFKVPNIVAMAAEEELRLEMTVLDEVYDEKIRLSEAAGKVFREKLPFDYDMRESDELEICLGSAYITDSWQGEEDKKYKWIIQNISLINWAESEKNVKEALYSMLTYKDTYGFEAQIILPKEQLGTLEAIQGQLLYHVPLIVSTAEKDTLSLEIRLSGDTWAEALDINDVQDYWTLLSNVFPYEKENVLQEVDEFTDGTAADIVLWNNHFYLVVDIKRGGYYYRWDEAKEYCEQLGGHLVTITSEEEQQIVHSCIKNLGENTQYWAGGFWNEDTKEWEWVTGERMEYQNWDSRQTAENGGYLELYNSGLWDDTYSYENYYMRGYICEWEF